MSVLGMSFCAKLLEDPPEDITRLFQETKLTLPMFRGASRSVYRIILEHYKEYKKLPSWPAIFDKCPESKPLIKKNKEPLIYYENMIYERHIKNILRDFVKTQTAELAKLDGSAIAIVEAAKGLVRTASSELNIGGGRILNIRETGDMRLEHYNKLVEYDDGIIGYRSMFPVLDRALGGFRKGGLYTLAARSGTGKSWFAVFLAETVYRQHVNVGFISPEMTYDEIFMRRDSFRYKLNFMDFSRGQLDSISLEYYKDCLKKEEADVNDWFFPTEGIISDITDVELFVEQTGIDFIVVDGMYLIKSAASEGRNDKQIWEKVGENAKFLKRLAKKKDICVFITTQFNKNQKSNKKKGDASHLAFSDAILHNSDALIGQYQDEDMRLNNEMRFQLLKNRHGPQVEFTTEWDLNRMEFSVVESEGQLIEGGAKDLKAVDFQNTGQLTLTEEEDIPF